MNNTFPQIAIIFDRRKTASPTTKATVEVRISHNYKQKFISTGIRLYSTQWKNGKIINCPNIIEISQTLDKIITDIRQVIFDMLQTNNLNISAIPRELERKSTRQLTFLEYCKQRAIIRKYGKKQDSQERYNRFLRLFTKWGKIISFEDITETNIIAYDKYLTAIKMKASSRWNNYHRFLNSFIMDAIKENHLTRNPYDWINISREKSSSGLNKYLSIEEFNQIKNTKMHTESLEKVKDVFLFQTYTCLSYTDLKNFNTKNIQEVNGMKVYTGSRNKTNKPFTVPLLPIALSILDKYNYKLPVISNVKYNEYLKIVAQTANIDKPLSSHWARHTGATLLLNKGIPMQIVSKICGHSSIKITEQIYAKLLDETIVDAVNSVKDKL